MLERPYKEEIDNLPAVLGGFRQRFKAIGQDRDIAGIQELTRDLSQVLLATDRKRKAKTTPHQQALDRFRTKIVDPYLLVPSLEKEELSNEQLADAIELALASLSEEDRLLLQSEPPAETDHLTPIGSIKADFPPPILSIPGFSGSILAEGSVSVLAGEGGVSKSTLALEIATRVSHQGERWQDDPLQSTRNGNVLYVSYEDRAGVLGKRYDDIRYREGKAMPLTRDYQLYVKSPIGNPLFGPPEGGMYSGRPQRLAGWEMLARQLNQKENWRLLIIDPALSAFVGNANEAAPVREFMANLTMLAEEYRMGILLIAHTNKDSRRHSNDYTDLFRPGQIGGSTHWTDAARGVLNFYHGREEGERLLVVPKANWGPSHLGCQLKLRKQEGRGFGGFTTGPEGWMVKAKFLEFLKNSDQETPKRKKIT